MDNSRPGGKLGMVGCSVIPSSGGIYSVISPLDAGGGIDIGDMSRGVILEFIGDKSVTILTIHEEDIIAEARHLGRGGILAIDRSEGIDIIVELASGGVPTELRIDIIIEAICNESHGSVLQFDITARGAMGESGMLRESVIEEFVGIDEECITLTHLDMAESIERILRRVIISGIAKHPHTTLAELNGALDDLELLELIGGTI